MKIGKLAMVASEHCGLSMRSEAREETVSVQTFKVGVQYILQTGYLPLDRLGMAWGRQISKKNRGLQIDAAKNGQCPALLEI